MENTNGYQNHKRLYEFVKRVFDFLVALVALVILALPMLVIGICIKKDSTGPALLKQKRVGRYGKEFTLYKFRTMYMDAPQDLATSRLRAMEDPDQYITPLGKKLRKTSLDELPQLVNILKGDMSLVGYRPVCTTELKLNKLREEYGVFAHRPGMTGLAQVRGRDDIYYKDKALIDAEYERTRSFKVDIRCLLDTIPTVTSGKGVK